MTGDTTNCLASIPSISFSYLDMTFASPLVSFYSNAKATTERNPKSLLSILEDIRAGMWQTPIEYLRALSRPEYKEKKKDMLPGFTTLGTFTERKQAGFEQPSGVLAMDIDLDGNEGRDLGALRQDLLQDSYTLAVFWSASGKGLAVLCRIPETTNQEQIRGHWRALKTYLHERYNALVDISTPNIDRLRFVSYDPELHLNLEANIFEATEEKKKPAVRATGYALSFAGNKLDFGGRFLAKKVAEIMAAPAGERHAKRRDAAYACGGLVGSGYLEEEVAFDELYGAFLAVNDGSGQETARSTIRSGLRKGAMAPWEPQKAPFQLTGPQKLLVQTQASRGVSRPKIARMLTIDNPDDLADTAEAIDELLDAPEEVLLTFWNVKIQSQGGKKVELAKTRFGAWLNTQGFFKLMQGENPVVVRVVEQVVSVVTTSQIIDHVKNYVNTLPERFDGIDREGLSDMLYGRVRDVFDAMFFLTLPLLAGEFMRDTATTSYHFFNNCYTETTKYGTVCHQYNKMQGYIWQEQKKARDFTPLANGGQGSDFNLFMRFQTAHNPQRLLSLECAVGYLSHGYKDPTEAKCVVLCEQFAEKGRKEGGTGKSLLMVALEEITSGVKLEGANFNFDKDFKWATIKEGTRLAWFDEWPAHLSFDRLFSEITGALVINRKHKAPVTVEFADSPKFAITTNDMVLGEGSSFERRKVEIPLARYFTANHTPKHEFGRGFFDQGWDDQDYNRFYNLALGWVQKFLTHGLIKVEVDGMATRKLAELSSEDFVKFAANLKDSREEGAQGGLWEWVEKKGNRYLAVWLSDIFAMYQGLHPSKLGATSFAKFMEAAGFSKDTCVTRGTRRFQTFLFLPENTVAVAQ